MKYGISFKSAIVIAIAMTIHAFVFRDNISAVVAMLFWVLSDLAQVKSELVEVKKLLKGRE